MSQQFQPGDQVSWPSLTSPQYTVTGFVSSAGIQRSARPGYVVVHSRTRIVNGVPESHDVVPIDSVTLISRA